MLAMCVRMCPLTAEEAQAVLDARHDGRGQVLEDTGSFDSVHDANPGVPAYATEKNGKLAVARFVWGFPFDGKQNIVFNTRIEYAIEQLCRGRRGMWADANANGRRFVPARILRGL